MKELPISAEELAIDLTNATLPERVALVKTWGEKKYQEGELNGMHAGIELAEENIVSVVGSYREERYKGELKNARRSLKIAFKQLHASVDQGVSFNLTPVGKSQLEKEEQ